MPSIRVQTGILIGGLCLLQITGCASMRRGPFLGLKADDPPALSPYNRSLTDGGTRVTVPYQAARPPGQAGTQLGAPESIPEPIDSRRGPQLSNPPQTIRQRPDHRELEAPKPATIEPPTELGEPEPIERSLSALVLTINQPDDVLVSEAATFEITIRNPRTTPAEDVVIECRFGEGLAFPGSSERALRQQLGTLGAAEVRTLDLSLTVEQAGTHCVDFLLTATGRESTTDRRCVTCVEPTVSMDLVGPTSRTVGGRLECVLSLVNVTGREVSAVVASITHDGALVAREASAGAIRKPGRLEWDLGLLGVDERVQIQVEFACPTRSEQTCIAAEVTGRDMPMLQRELCAAIRPRQTLDVTVADARDPLPVGETTTYLVTVTNHGLETLRELRLDVELDGGLEIIRAGDAAAEIALGHVSTGSGTATVTATIPIVGPISPDDSRTVQIDVRATRVGRGGVKVTATDLSTAVSVMTDEPTVINPPLLDWPSFEGPIGSRFLP